MSERRIIQLLARYRVANLDEFVERLGYGGRFLRLSGKPEDGTQLLLLDIDGDSHLF